MWKTLFIPKVTRQDDTHARVEIWNEMEEVGTLYYERPKVGWTKKPISTNEWVCVDAHIEYFSALIEDHDVTPKEIVEWGNDAIKKAFS